MNKMPLLLIVLLVAGCRQVDVDVEDNSPNFHERRSALTDCVGHYPIDEANPILRVLCTFAIYGD